MKKLTKLIKQWGQDSPNLSRQMMKLFLFIAVLAVKGTNCVWADTSRLTAQNGWTKVTDLSTLTLSDYYFAFVDDTRDLMLSYGQGVNNSGANKDYMTMVYRTGEKAEMNPAMLWTLESNTNGGYSIKNATEATYFLQTESDASWFCRTNDNGLGDASWYNWVFAYANGSWTIKNGKYNSSTGYTDRFIGPWNPANFNNGAEVAGNKENAAEVGHFQIYAILKTNVDWQTKASATTPANYTYKIVNPDFECGASRINGWTSDGTNHADSQKGAIAKSGAYEAWNASGFSLKQTVTGLPNGLYRLSVQAVLPSNGTDQNVQLVANDIEKTITAPYSSGVYTEVCTALANNSSLGLTSIDVNVTDGNLELGMQATEGGWVIFDNFQLYYLGTASANVSDAGSISATATITNNDQTCTWTNLNIGTQINANQYGWGNGLGAQAGSSNLGTGALASLKSVQKFYIKVPSASSTGTVKFTCGSDATERKIYLKSGTAIEMKKNSPDAISFNSRDIVNINGGYYLEISNSSIDFKPTSIAVTLTTGNYSNTAVPVTYTITYNANGATSGDVPVDGNSPYTSGTWVRVIGNPGNLAKTGYTFNGWRLGGRDSGNHYLPSEIESPSGKGFNIDRNWTLYAQWVANTYTVTYDATTNGGTCGTASQNYTYDGAYLELPAATNGTMRFNGWFTAAVGGEKVTEIGTRFKPTSDITLYAQFSNPEITITGQPVAATYTEFVAATPLSVTATANTGDCAYQWQSSTNNSNFTDVKNATSATYTPATTSIGTIYYRCVVSAVDCENVTSTSVAITVNGGSSSTENLVEIAAPYTFTPSAAIPQNTLADDNRIISAAGGNDYKAGYGLNFKNNRYLAFKVPAGVTILVEAGNYGTSGTRTIWLGNSNSNETGLKNLKTQDVAQGTTATLSYKTTAAGVVYLAASSDLYLKSINIIGGYALTYDYNGHHSVNVTEPDQTNLPDPLSKPEADGYSFVGWFTNSGLTSVAIPGTTLSGATTIYAKWIINKGNNVKFDANGITSTVTELVQPQTGMAIALPAAYETAEDIAIPANATDDDKSNWSFASEVTTNKNLYVFNGVKTDFREAFIASSLGAKDVLTQSVSVANGKYEVVLDVAASATNIRDHQQAPLPTGNNLTKAFAGNAEQFIPVIDRTAFDPETDYDRVVLVTDVTNGTLTYGIKNVAASGNWYVCRVHSIKKIDDSNFTGWYDAKTGGTKVGDAGADYTPQYNNTTLYAHWNKTYNFRPVAKQGTITSVTVNDQAVAFSNNVDIKVRENAKIVMTVAANSGYKFKNWSNNGTVGEESNNGLTYTISQIKANTTLTANFVALSDATDPNPANGVLSGTTVTINTFPAAYGEKQQSVNLGLPEGATAVVKTADGSLNASITDGVLSIKAPTAPSIETPNQASITITVTAENGSTKDYTVTVKTGQGSSIAYTVKAMDGSTVLKEIASGDYAEGTGDITVYYPQHILKNGTLYELSKETDANGWYRKIFTPTAETHDITINKKTTVSNVVYFTEAEDLPGFTGSSSGSANVRSSMGVVARSGDKFAHACTLNKGTYRIVARSLSSHDRTATFNVGNDTYTFNYSSTISSFDQRVVVTEDNTDVSVAVNGDSADGLDWFYIQDLGVLPVKEDGQTVYLTKANHDANLYFTAYENWQKNKDTGAYSESTRDGVRGVYNDLKYQKNALQYIELNTNGATAFEVFVDGDDKNTRSIKVFVAGTGKTTFAKSVSGLESTGIILTGSNNTDRAIRIEGAGSSSIYPVKVKFYTSPMLVGGSTTVTMGKGAQEVDITATGGRIEMATPSAQAATFVTATFNTGTNKLSLTPVKAGVAHLSFTITDGDKQNTVDYVVNVVKQPVTITYLANGTDIYNATPDVAFTSPTVVVKDEAGTDITSTVSDNILRISDDETLVKYNGTTAQLLPNVQGVAKLKAVLYNNPVYENAMAIFTVNVTSGIDKKLYEMGTDSKGNPIKVGLAEPAINSTLVAEQGGKVLMTMTYGGYKHQDKLIKEGQDGYKIWDSKTSSYKIVKDSWKGNGGKFSAYNGQGTDIYGHAFDNQIDDFGFQVQAQQDSRDEYKSGIDWYTTSDVKPNGTHYTEYERIKPFSLPVSGAYLKFEAEVNGTLTAYVLQNGNITFSDDEGHRDEPDAIDPLGTNPRVYYWFNQDGYRIDPTSYTSKQPLTIGRDWNGELAKQIQEWIDRSDLPGLKKYLIDDNAWPVQSEVNANLQKPVPTPQTVVRYQEGYMVAQKAYVKYVVPVVAGDTYYFFSNASKVGAAGFNFLPAEDGTVDLILPEDGGSHPTIPANTNDDVVALNCTSDNAATHRTTSSIEMHKTVTLPRKFKVNTWSTICLPFHVTETQVEKVFGKGTNLVIYNGISKEGKARLQKHVNQDILAGQPYFIYPTGVDADGNPLENVYNDYIGGENTLITFHNVNFTPNVAVQSYASDKDGDLGTDGYGTSQEEPSFIFTGTLEPTRVKKYDYYINNNTGNFVRYTGSGTNLNAYYAYLKNPSEEPVQAGAKVISGVDFGDIEGDEDVPTGIMEVLVDMGMEIRPVEGVFNLSGQKIADSTKNLPSGIYIVNGIKVNIK